MGRTYYLAVRMGCSRRVLDAGRIDRYFRKNGWTPGRARSADILIVCTCGGMSGFEHDSVRTIRRLVRVRKEGATVISTGCMEKINPKALKGIRGAKVVPYESLGLLDQVISASYPFDRTSASQPPRTLHDLDTSYIARLKGNFSPSLNFCRHTLSYAAQSIRVSGRRLDEILFGKLYRLEISRGCVGRCTYCGIKLAMGELRSRPRKKIVSEFRQALRKGYKRFSIVAGDAGCYGVDIGETLPSLLGDLLAEKGDYKVSLNDIHPTWLITYQEGLIRLLKKHHRKVRKLLVPIQSGSDRILKKMGRGYKISDVKEVLHRLKREVPGLRLETHIIVGFPGETEEDFRKSKELVREIGFSLVDTYQFDARPGTRAATMPGKVLKTVIARRTKELCSSR